jgi:putative nucleotidyltransferase with HDIG domain
MRIRPIHAYVGGVAAASVVASSFLDWSFPAFSSWHAVLGFSLLTVLGLLSEASAVKLTVGRSTGNASVTFIPLIACVTIFGPAAAVLFFAFTGTVVEFGIRRKESIRGLFNVGQYALATAMGGLAFQTLGGSAAVPLSDFGGDAQFHIPYGPLIVFGIVFLVLNHTLVSIAIAISERLPFSTVLRRVLGQSGGSIASDVFTSPLGILVAFLYFHFWIFGLLISLLPLVFIRYAYIAKQKLENANRDLLQALVKAIEIRDPYTSGHSVRVQDLSLKIGRLLSLGERKLEELRTAALLHDIGKIEVVYEQILMKPGKLSAEERAMMESHVTRGVDILKSLASFDARIVNAVRHHHENYDGTGYPDRIRSLDIPLYARIIKISDSIDAMLSDRPYRAAMSPGRVARILLEEKGREYDPDVVDAVLAADLVTQHQQELLLTQRASVSRMGNNFRPSLLLTHSVEEERDLGATRELGS